LRLFSAIVEKDNNAKYQMFNREQMREEARFDFAYGNRELSAAIYGAGV
jgi:hypothetical protein